MNLLPYPAYKNSNISWLEDIPINWKLGLGLSYLSYLNKKNIGMKVSRVLSLSYGKIIVKNIEKLHGLVPTSFETYQIVSPGNIVIRGTDLQNDKVSLRVGKVKNEGIITSAYLCLKVNKNINSNYMYYLLHGYDLKKIYYSMGSGLRQNLNFNNFKRLPILLPTFDEQIQITKFLDYKIFQITKFIHNKLRLIKLLKEQKQVIVNQAVTRGLEPNVKLKSSGVEWIGEIPVHWEIRKIRHLYKKIGSGTTPQSGDMTYYDGNISWINSGDLTDNSIFKTARKVTEKAIQDYSMLKIYPTGSLVIAMYGATIGKASITKMTACTNQACCVLFNESNDINTNYMLKLFLKIKPYLNQIGYGGGQPNISQDTIKSLRLPIPPIKEQEEIVSYIQKENNLIDQTISRAEREVKLIREYQTRLISDVVTGKVDVRHIVVPDFDKE